MRRRGLPVLLAATPSPALAHDAFGDLGPFYAGLLHPLADPLQAALVVGTAAFLAGRPIEIARVALPVFVAATALGLGLLGWRLGLVPAPLLLAAGAVLIGLAATLPARWTPVWASLALVAVTGALAGLAPGQPDGGTVQPLLGGLLGIGILTALAWAGLDALARRLAPIAPAIAGSWVAAIGMLAGAFALQPASEGDAAAQLDDGGALAAGGDR
ncbi:HupE/UreJ family protein [Palleronia sp. KMU-117]|uniref:HupE/UreJ family protein n=1 Tax=Palleronia sp. KMU-117 TaxID=3434108 RepID=UPI003D75E517